MSDNKPTVFQIMEDCAGLIDSLQPEEQAQAITALATRYKMRVMPVTTGGSGPRPTYRKRFK